MFGFVSAAIHVRALEELSSERAQREVVERQSTSDQLTIRWLCARVNQLEQERAVLFHAVTQLNIPVPTVTPAPAVPATHAPANDPAQAITEQLRPFGIGIFEDMGDDEARRQGVDHDSEGRVVYRK